MFNMAVILSIPKGHTRQCRNFEGFSDERKWEKLAKNLSASPPKRDLWIDITFRQTHLAGQSL
jgi:hypothetical protein